MRKSRSDDATRFSELITVSTQNTALIVVDVQNDFVDSRGSLYVQDAQSVVPNINHMISNARSEGRLIVYTQDWHPEITPHFAKDGGIWPVHCVGDTWGAEFYRELVVVPDGEFVRKGTSGEDGYSGFSVRDPQSGSESDTAMERILRERGVDRVDVVGIATDYCVKETTLDARQRGFTAVVYRNCMKGVDLSPGDSDTAISAMIEAGVEVRDA